jgi:hypothetical protein
MRTPHPCDLIACDGDGKHWIFMISVRLESHVGGYVSMQEILCVFIINQIDSKWWRILTIKKILSSLVIMTA